jgi:uncharacterized protein (TIGR00303 family)
LIYEGVDFTDIKSVNDRLSSGIPFKVISPLFILVISYTGTSCIPGITAAGQNKDLIKYTSPADAEFLNYGHCTCIDHVPVTPEGIPTPAIITKAALDLANIPFLIIDAGSIVKPGVPYISFDLKPGDDIRSGAALDESYVEKGVRYGEALGHQLSKISRTVIIGESIPGGTTTALGVLVALGIDAWSKVSSSLPESPHSLKNKVVQEGLTKAGIQFGDFENEPLRAITAVGDPMIPAVTGLACGISDSGSNVMLSGGTQMTAVLAVIKAMNRPLDRLCIGTTSYVAHDPSSDIRSISKEISPNLPIYAIDLHFDESKKPGLQTFARGFVKDGAGAGGVSIIAMLKSAGSLTAHSILKSVERQYDSLLLHHQTL